MVEDWNYSGHGQGEDVDVDILSRWLKGECGIDELRQWLRGLYPPSMYDAVEQALEGDIPTEELDGLEEAVEKAKLLFLQGDWDADMEVFEDDE